ncbi:hypothetical protein GCM10023206_06810 [Acinetobacter puyangensis]|uniref:Phage baseplate assembly protein V n=1 Tax=Acinetobacter puyangensis TaxID=1096779 RepID=A0A240E8N5_9GAMM|nr:hypothetical protein [Acinetobacter puyangensis]SNX44240.1 hypothetical protein SAMN05421731_102401 [Acinetobacter puyangensis]
MLSYDASNRTAKVHIFGLTDGASEGLTATFAYPVGDDDRDTERQIVLQNDVYVFFEGGDEARPVIAFYSSHGSGNTTDIRRIRQKNIELLATAKVAIAAPEIYLTGHVIIDGDITHTGNQTTIGTITATVDMVADGVSTVSHDHSGVERGSGDTNKPNKSN